MTKNRAFTLIELMVVVSIISVLASVVLAALSSARNKANDSKKIQTIRQVDTAIALYASNVGHAPLNHNGSLPACEGSSAYNQSMQELVDAKVYPVIPKSPTDTPYCYFNYDESDDSGTSASFFSDISDGSVFSTEELVTPAQKNAKTVKDVIAIAQALNNYKVQHGNYPSMTLNSSGPIKTAYARTVTDSAVCMKRAGKCIFTASGGNSASPALMNEITPYLPVIPKTYVTDPEQGLYDSYIYLSYGVGSYIYYPLNKNDGSDYDCEVTGAGKYRYGDSGQDLQCMLSVVDFH